MSQPLEPLTVFCARSSGPAAGNSVQQQHQWLHDNLESYTKPAFFMQWGRRESINLTVVRSARLAIHSDVFNRVQSVLLQCQKERRPFEFIMNGYAGFTCKMGEWVRLFKPFVGSVDMQLVAWVGEPRVFTICKMDDFIECAQGGNDDDDEDSMDARKRTVAGTFYEHIEAEYRIREAYSECVQMSVAVGGRRRNTPSQQWVCEGCGDTWTTCKDLGVHRARCPEVVPEEKRTCPRCNGVFAQVLGMKNHLAVCTGTLDRLDASMVDTSMPSERARLTSRANDRKVTHSIDLPDRIAPTKKPRLDEPAPTTISLTSVRPYDRLLVRPDHMPDYDSIPAEHNEHFCRAKGCTEVKKFEPWKTMKYHLTTKHPEVTRPTPNSGNRSSSREAELKRHLVRIMQQQSQNAQSSEQ